MTGSRATRAAWVLLTLVACAKADPIGGGPAGQDAPNLLLVVLDDVGADSLPLEGAATPTLDGLAAEGIRFETAWSAPACSPTRAALLTGRHGVRTGLGERVDPQDDYELPAGEVTIAEVLAPAGYTSVAAGKWHVSSLPDHPLREGFAAHAGAPWNLSNHTAAVEGPTDYYRWERCEDGVCAEDLRYETTAAVDDALALVAEAPEPWFLYLALHAAHEPFQSPPGRDASSEAEAYAQMLEAADAELGRLLEALPSAPTVLVVGDNGTPPEIAPDPSRAKSTLYEGGLRVPLIVRSPLVTEAGAVSPALVHVVDVLPTLAELAGAPLLAEIDGQSLVPSLLDPAAASREVLVTSWLHTNGPPPWPIAGSAARDRDHKLIRTVDGDFFFALEDGLEAPDPIPSPTGAEELARAELAAALDALAALPWDH